MTSTLATLTLFAAFTVGAIVEVVVNTYRERQMRRRATIERRLNWR